MDENLTNGDRFVRSYLCQKNPVYSSNRGAKIDSWKSVRVQRHFDELENGWNKNCDLSTITETMSQLLHEIDLKLNYDLTAKKRQTFLDIGAATGGFSFYLLNFERIAHKGYGITLPVEKGGYEMLLEPSPYYEFMYADIVEDFDTIVMSFEANKRMFSLCICDANLTDKSKKEDGEKRKELLVYQLKLALMFLENSGDLLIKLSSSASAFNISILVLLNTIFDITRAVKPQTCHRVRSSYYLFCSNFNKDKYNKNFDLDRYREDSIDFEKINVLNTRVIDLFGKSLAHVWNLQKKALNEFRRR